MSTSERPAVPASRIDDAWIVVGATLLVPPIGLLLYRTVGLLSAAVMDRLGTHRPERAAAAG